MVRVKLPTLALTAMLGSCGCGTIVNLKHPTFTPPDRPGAEVCRAWGAVRTDIAAARDYDWQNPASYADYVLLPVLMAVNLTLDAIGDTITLPYTLVSELRRAWNRPEQPSPSGHFVAPGTLPNTSQQPTRADPQP